VKLKDVKNVHLYQPSAPCARLLRISKPSIELSWQTNLYIYNLLEIRHILLS
jgi:hypothetical protein